MHMSCYEWSVNGKLDEQNRQLGGVASSRRFAVSTPSAADV